jgi:hypothetical protein
LSQAYIIADKGHTDSEIGNDLVGCSAAETPYTSTQTHETSSASRLFSESSLCTCAEQSKHIVAGAQSLTVDLPAGLFNQTAMQSDSMMPLDTSLDIRADQSKHIAAGAQSITVDLPAGLFNQTAMQSDSMMPLDTCLDVRAEQSKRIIAGAQSLSVDLPTGLIDQMAMRFDEMTPLDRYLEESNTRLAELCCTPITPNTVGQGDCIPSSAICLRREARLADVHTNSSLTVDEDMTSSITLMIQPESTALNHH